MEQSVAKVSRRHTENAHQKTMADALSEPHLADRAALMMLLLAGVQVMCQTVGLRALTTADPKVLEQLMAQMLRPLIEGHKLVDTDKGSQTL